MPAQAEITDEDFRELERFVVILYDRTCSYGDVNQAWQVLFSKSTCSLENTTPTQTALQEHIKHDILQVGYIWAQATIKQPDLPCTKLWGWNLCEHRWTPKWTTLSEAHQRCVSNSFVAAAKRPAVVFASVS